MIITKKSCSRIRAKGRGGDWGMGEFKPGTINSKPLVYFPHELTPVPSLLRKEGCLCENLHLYFPIHQLSIAILREPSTRQRF